MKIKPKLSNLFIQSSPQETGNPINDCWVMVHADIGPEGTKAPDGTVATDIFLFYVTTPKHLINSVKGEDYRFGRGLLIVEEYSEALIRKAFEKLLSSIEGDNWEEVANKINRYGHWEFENYDEWKDHSKVNPLKRLFGIKRK